MDAFDPTERIAQAAWNSSDGTDHMYGRIQENYQYDRTGRLTAAISGGMRYDYRYDRKNQLLAKTAGGRTLVSYAYDADGNRTASTDVTGNCTRYTYDLLGKVSIFCEKIDMQRQPFAEGKLEWADVPAKEVRDEKTGFLATYEYTKTGDLKKVNTPVLHTAYAYDGDRNLTALRTMAAGDASVEKLLADNVYRYNKNGQRTEKTTLAGTTKYTYDVLGQLVQENDHIYTYDRAGNRTSVQAGDRRESYHYDRGRLTTRTVEHTQDPAGKTYTYRYDAQGNTLGDGENTYLYDCLNRIAEVQTKAGDIQKNHYDAEGLRSQMEENGKLVSFIYADREVITEEDEAGAHIRYIRGHELLASDSAHARTYYHYACDEMGSITDITDCDGTVLNHYAYDAFGNRTVEEETVENRFGFAGEMLDAVTGQYYLRARFYNPVIARFLSEDTYYGDGLNLYAYCHNNPVGYVDPSGHICEKKYNAVESLREQDGSNAADALKKYKELREQGYTPEQIKNGDYKKSSDFGKGGNDTVLALPAPSGTNPWLEGSEIVSMLAPTDCYIDMALAPGQNKPGGWGTFDSITDVNYVRNALAVTPEFKPEVGYVQRYKIPEGIRIQVGTVGPQKYKGKIYAGGGNQVQILNFEDRAKLVPIGKKRPIYQAGGIVLKNEIIVLKSKKNNYTYMMHEDIIIASSEDKEYTIDLPHKDNILCFYDMYYINNNLIVIVAARGSYDIRYELDEEGLILKEIAYTK